MLKSNAKNCTDPKLSDNTSHRLKKKQKNKTHTQIAHKLLQ